jgi:hypothetical protein
MNTLTSSTKFDIYNGGNSIYNPTGIVLNSGEFMATYQR